MAEATNVGLAAPAQDEPSQPTHAGSPVVSTSTASTATPSLGRLNVTAPYTTAQTTPASAPATPRIEYSRPPAQSAASPLQQHASSPRQPTLRRTSSNQSLGSQRPSSSPSQLRRTSRSSFGAQQDEAESKVTPKRSISGLVANLREARGAMESIEEPVPLTAAQVAVDHFARELLSHTQPEATADTVVILHDACYGHRWSRLKTTKTTLSMIVERPERIHASILGAATAYVRLGEHHKGAKNAPHPDRNPVAPPPFHLRRTARTLDITSPCVASVHGTEWMGELKAMCDLAGVRLAAGEQELAQPENTTMPERRKLHEGDLYLATESLNAFQGALGGVADAVDAVFQPISQTSRAFVAVRPPGHHCSADHPSGFCWINNVHVGIEYAAQNYGLTHAAIIDFDLHHGDGSQAITWERNSKNNEKRLNAKPNSKLKLSPDIGYYSLHDINSYPCEMGDQEKVQAASICVENAHGQDVWNVHLQPWRTEDEFWALYEGRYLVLLEKAKNFLRRHTDRLRAERKVQPKAAIFISAGFDASEWEGAGMQRHKVNVPTEFYARFTRDMVRLAQEPGTGCEGRVISVLEGGYSDRALCSGVLSHLSGLCGSPIDTLKKEDSSSVANQSIDQMMNGLRINGMSRESVIRYDKSWWSEANLTVLELKVNPPPPPQAKKVRTGPQPTYATPTESFAYKVIDPAKFARSVSGTMRESPIAALAAPLPPPEVDWVVATQELHKLLIPIDRQTKSCTAEELGGVKTKKERQSVGPTVSNEEAAKPRQLRDRGRAKTPLLPGAQNSNSDESETTRRPSFSGTRRQTMHEVPSASKPAVPPSPSAQRRTSRRLSAGSSLSSRSGDVDMDAPPVPPLPSVKPATAPRSLKPPSATTASGVQVKRTRAPPKAKKDITSASAPVSPVNHKTKPPNGLPPPGTTAMPARNELDSLTSGIKKITLKVGSREEHDRKQREREAAERKARALKGAETRRINAAAKKAAQGNSSPTPTPSIASNPPSSSPIVADHSATFSSNGVPTHNSIAPNQGAFAPTSLHQPGLPESIPVATLPMAVSDAYGTSSIPQVPMHHPSSPTIGIDAMSLHPHGLAVLPTPAPSTIAPSIPPDSAARQLLHENATAFNEPQNTPLPPQRSFSPDAAKGSPRRSSPRRKAELPVFTSTGTIPFAPVPAPPLFNAGIAQASSPPRGREPPPPPRLEPETVAPAMTETMQAAPGTINPPHESVLPTVRPIKQQQGEAVAEGMSVWDVPPTPNAH